MNRSNIGQIVMVIQPVCMHVFAIVSAAVDFDSNDNDNDIDGTNIFLFTALVVFRQYIIQSLNVYTLFLLNASNAQVTSQYYKKKNELFYSGNIFKS